MQEQHLPDRVLTGTVVTGTTGTDALTGELAHLIPAARAALLLLADAIRRGGADQADIVQAVKDGGLSDAYADIFDAASAAVWDAHARNGGDPYDFDARLERDNLSDIAGALRDAISPHV
ncbi:hypothetical protein [Kitasatospora griseola]|uniref:hypothetical protein n=1 Tax=Kitasatospora griseola TaxID=2064 RepID=UPI0034399A89